jgi:FkbM family methyltransferase
MKHYFTVLIRHPRRWRFLIGKLLVKTGLCRFLIVQQSGYKLRFHQANLAEQLWINPMHRAPALKMFHLLLRSGDKVVDVGANIGDTTLLSSILVGTDGGVTAIEAHPRTFARLEENLRLNNASNVRAVHSAVGHQSGFIDFSDSPLDDMNQVGGGELRVPIRPLDDILSSTEVIDLLKVDVEGYEKFVFEGATDMLQRVRFVFFESGEAMAQRFGYSISDLLVQVADAGFSMFQLVGASGLSPVRDVKSFKSDSVENFVAARDVDALFARVGTECFVDS